MHREDPYSATVGKKHPGERRTVGPDPDDIVKWVARVQPKPTARRVAGHRFAGIEQAIGIAIVEPDLRCLGHELKREF